MSLLSIFAKISLILCGIFLSITQISCKSDDDSKDNCADTFCTLEFVTYSISIVDENQNPVALDSFMVVDVESGTDITLMLTPSQLEEAQQQGRYPLITDGIFDVNQEKEVRFSGFLDNQVIVIEDYVVATDCCHVSLVSGNIKLII